MRAPRPRRRSRAGSVASVLVVAVSLGAPAAAAPACAFDPATATATVTVGNGETATIARSGDAITLDGAPCGTATVTTTDAVVVDATGIPAEVVLDLAGGAFAPGMTAETDGGDPEIEFTINLPAGSPTVRIVGGAGVDTIVTGEAGINLNAVEPVGDIDVLVVGLPTVLVQGGAGGDVLSVAGGSGTGTASTARLDGGDDGDLLIGAAGGNGFEGGGGPDTLDYAAATQLVEANLGSGVVEHAGGQVDAVSGIENLTGSPGADLLVGDAGPNVLRGGDGDDVLVGAGDDDELDGEAGEDAVDHSGASGPVTINLPGRVVTGEGTDRLTSIEHAIGSAFDDTLYGDDGPNDLVGGDGNDRIDGGDSDDLIDGGPGFDTADFGRSDQRVAVHLGKGTASGDGADTLVAIESVTGSTGPDVLHGDEGPNVLAGGGGRDELRGRNGRDHLHGGDANDLLFGQRGRDDLLGGAGNDQLDGGKGNDDVCRGGGGADAFVFCEVVKVG